jgi:hypothetical protein
VVNQGGERREWTDRADELSWLCDAAGRMTNYLFGTIGVGQRPSTGQQHGQGPEALPTDPVDADLSLVGVALDLEPAPSGALCGL